MSIDREGRLYLNIGERPQASLDEQTVGARAALVLSRNPETQVLVKADTAVAYGRVVQAMVDRLTNLIGIFQKPELDFSQNRAEHDDILGDAY